MKIIHIDWWLGRVIAMTWPITELAKREEVRVITSRPLAFWGNPYIKSVHWDWDRALWENVIKWNDYFNLEPYTDSKFFNEWENWLKVSARLLWVEESNPILYLAEHEKLNNTLWWDKPVLFQPFWSTMQLNWADKSYRSFKIEDAQYIADNLIQNWYTVYVVERDDQPKLQWCNQLTVNDMRWLVSLTARYPVIWCDSSMHHWSKAFWKKALVMRAGTDSWRFGYDTSINMRNDEKYEYVPFRLWIDFNTDIQNQNCNKFSKEWLDKFIMEWLNLLDERYNQCK